MAMISNSQIESYKELSPKDTLNNIRSIASSIGLSFHEQMWNTYGENCYSVRISSSDKYSKLLKTNGKGLSTELALASAYAEMLERLQNTYIDFLSSRVYGLMPEALYYQDERWLKYSQISCEKNKFLNSLISINSPYNFQSHSILCAPYFKLLSKKIEYLPVELIKYVCGSNGMCAGNTPAEAIRQGICELFERNSIKSIYQNSFSVPTIPTDEVKDCYCYSTIEQMQKAGFKVIIKDCSLGGIFPVIAVMAFNPDTGKYHVNFGSDPIFQIALERCLTEWWQGYSNSTYSYQMENLEWSDAKYFHWSYQGLTKRKDVTICNFFKDGIAHLPDNFFISNGRPKHQEAFLKHNCCNKKILSKIINIIEQQKKDIYIRDVSYLGFPTYHVYIPTYSEVYNKLEETHLFARDFIRKTLLNLKNSSKKEIMKCANLISEIAEKTPAKIFPKKLLPRLSGISVKNDTDFYLFNNTDYMLTVLYTRAGCFEKAYRHLNEDLSLQSLNNNSKLVNRSYFEGLRACMYLMMNNCEESKVRSSVVDLVGTETYNQIESDLKEHDRILNSMSLPKCGNCNLCEVKGACFYPIWKNLVVRLSELMEKNSIDQRKISAVMPLTTDLFIRT